MSTLTINERIDPDNRCVLSLGGTLDITTVDLFEETIHTLFAEDKKDILVDLAGLEYFTSAGIWVFFESTLAAEECGARLRFANPTPTIRHMLDLVGLVNTLAPAAVA